MTLTIERIDIFPIRLRLHEPFIVSYATQYDIPTVLLRITTTNGQTGWGEESRADELRPRSVGSKANQSSRRRRGPEPFRRGLEDE